MIYIGETGLQIGDRFRQQLSDISGLSLGIIIKRTTNENGTFQSLPPLFLLLMSMFVKPQNSALSSRSAAYIQPA